MFRAWWYRRQRQIDVAMLWPVFTTQARSIEIAREAFRSLVEDEPAWKSLGPEEIARKIARLK